jgi:hypothetical protein
VRRGVALQFGCVTNKGNIVYRTNVERTAATFNIAISRHGSSLLLFYTTNYNISYPKKSPHSKACYELFPPFAARDTRQMNRWPRRSWKARKSAYADSTTKTTESAFETTSISHHDLERLNKLTLLYRTLLCGKSLARSIHKNLRINHPPTVPHLTREEFEPNYRDMYAMFAVSPLRHRNQYNMVAWLRWSTKIRRPTSHERDGVEGFETKDTVADSNVS